MSRQPAVALQGRKRGPKPKITKAVRRAREKVRAAQPPQFPEWVSEAEALWQYRYWTFEEIGDHLGIHKMTVANYVWFYRMAQEEVERHMEMS